VRLYDAARCPFCARVRLALAEKGVAYETVEIDLGNRPPLLYELNALGKVPVLDDGFPLPESAVILEYLEERFGEPALLPADPARRAAARLAVFRFDDLLGGDYYAFRRGDDNAVAERLLALPVGESLYVDFTFLPWVARLRELYGVELPDRLEAWLRELAARPAVAAELELVRGLA
jgi:glutathione S-transferase